jgi:metallo-beta-lactamase family protein
MNNRRSFIRLTSLATLGGLTLSGAQAANEAAGEQGIGLTFHGAAGRVSGSMVLATLPDGKVLMDCGSFYDEGGDASTLNAVMPAEALDASLLLLTHAHADHVGRISLLFERGFKGGIAATEPTLNLLRVMLVMGARYSDNPQRLWTWSKRKDAPKGRIGVFTLHWHPACRWAKAIREGNRQSTTGNWRDLKQQIRRSKADASPCKVCAELEVEPIMARCKSFTSGKPFQISKSTTCTAIEAGHLPGSVSFHLAAEFPAGRKHSMLFSGDLGPKQPLLQQGFAKAPAADTVVVECTYGAVKPQGNREADLERFRSQLISHLKRGAVVWIPCFALDRTEKVLMQIELALRAHGSELSRLPEVFVPSPSANDFHDLYRTGGAGWGLRPEYLNLAGRTRQGDESGFHSRMPKEVMGFLDAVKARDMELTGFPDPASLAPAAMRSLEGNIILTTSGMISEAFSEELFKPLARRESTAVFLVGYLDPQSTGGKLKTAEKEGKRFLEIDGEQVEIRAAVENFSGFSGHANAAEIDEWLAVHGKDSQVFLVHGDPNSLRERQQDLSAQGWRHVTIPQHQQHFQL